MHLLTCKFPSGKRDLYSNNIFYRCSTFPHFTSYMMSLTYGLSNVGMYVPAFACTQKLYFSANSICGILFESLYVGHIDYKCLSHKDPVLLLHLPDNFFPCIYLFLSDLLPFIIILLFVFYFIFQ